jgi:hypothetical protein
MTSEYPNIANNPYQDFSSTAPLCNELKSKIVLMELIISEKANELEPIFQKLDRMLVKEPSGRYLLEFDVESNEKGRPAMYKKQQVYNILYGITNRLITSKIKFFWWVAEHTNLAEKPETVKTMHKRAK